LYDEYIARVLDTESACLGLERRLRPISGPVHLVIWISDSYLRKRSCPLKSLDNI
jgi:hypothetical protein